MIHERKKPQLQSAKPCCGRPNNVPTPTLKMSTS